jgi:hypothetical protein
MRPSPPARQCAQLRRGSGGKRSRYIIQIYCSPYPLLGPSTCRSLAKFLRCTVPPPGRRAQAVLRPWPGAIFGDVESPPAEDSRWTGQSIMKG